MNNLYTSVTCSEAVQYRCSHIGAAVIDINEFKLPVGLAVGQSDGTHVEFFYRFGFVEAGNDQGYLLYAHVCLFWFV
jgi:hypothetical protein